MHQRQMANVNGLTAEFVQVVSQHRRSGTASKQKQIVGGILFCVIQNVGVAVIRVFAWRWNEMQRFDVVKKITRQRNLMYILVAHQHHITALPYGFDRPDVILILVARELVEVRSGDKRRQARPMPLERTGNPPVTDMDVPPICPTFFCCHYSITSQRWNRGVKTAGIIIQNFPQPAHELRRYGLESNRFIATQPKLAVTKTANAGALVDENINAFLYAKNGRVVAPDITIDDIAGHALQRTQRTEVIVDAKRNQIEQENQRAHQCAAGNFRSFHFAMALMKVPCSHF